MLILAIYSHRRSVTISNTTTTYKTSICLLSAEFETHTSAGQSRRLVTSRNKLYKSVSLTHDTVTERWTNDEIGAHANNSTWDGEDKHAPPPYLKPSSPLQQKPEEEQERELDAVDTGVEKKGSRVLKLHVQIKLAAQVWGWSFHTSPYIDLGLIVGQGDEEQGSSCDQ